MQQNYFLGRYGELTLATGGRLQTPTNRYRPGARGPGAGRRQHPPHASCWTTAARCRTRTRRPTSRADNTVARRRHGRLESPACRLRPDDLLQPGSGRLQASIPRHADVHACQPAHDARRARSGRQRARGQRQRAELLHHAERRHQHGCPPEQHARATAAAPNSHDRIRAPAHQDRRGAGGHRRRRRRA